MLDTTWMRLYEAAILETDDHKVPDRIWAAELAIAHEQQRVEISPCELQKLGDACSMLRTLRKVTQFDADAP